MANADLGTVMKKVHDILEPLSADDRQRVVGAVMTLLGEAVPSPRGGGSSAPGGGASKPTVSVGDVRALFDEKQPQTQIEQVAVAAYFLEKQGAESISKEEFASAFSKAKRSFDGRHFARDIAAAKASKLFAGDGKNVLTHYGESFVEALPDRERAKGLTPKGVKKTGKPSAKKKGG